MRESLKRYGHLWGTGTLENSATDKMVLNLRAATKGGSEKTSKNFLLKPSEDETNEQFKVRIINEMRKRHGM